MTLEEAIEHYEKLSKEQEKEAKEWHENQVRKCKLIRFAVMDYTHENECKKCAEEHRQLAEWLKELKQFKEQEPCEDVISRAEALKVINKMDIPEDMSVFEIKSHIGVEIGTLPPATSTHKKGKWEQYGDFWKEKYRCSECKEEQPKILCGEQIIRLWSNYCPHCGAEMESEE